MAVFRKNTYDTATLVLDGNDYVECYFKRCTLIYKGGPVFRLINNYFDDATFLFDGPAASTVAVLRAFLMHGDTLRSVALGALGLPDDEATAAEPSDQPIPSGPDAP